MQPVTLRYVEQLRYFGDTGQEHTERAANHQLFQSIDGGESMRSDWHVAC
jgi:hypothetical protein